MTIRSVTWGDDFSLKVTRWGGMPKVVARLEAAFGPLADSRATLDKLRRCHAGPAAMDDEERWRAYQVLVVIGQDPADWGIDRRSLGVPPSLVEYLHRAVAPPPGLEPEPAGNRRTTRVKVAPVTPWLSSRAPRSVRKTSQNRPSETAVRRQPVRRVAA